MAELSTAVIALVSLVIVLIAVGYAAITWGVDSRELTPDDHQRLDSWVGRTHRS